ncbi:hypothetical protein ABEW05_010592 [Botrytis cinerea]
MFGLSAAFRERHLVVYTLLCQLIIAVITFYCAIAISRYDTISTSTPRAVAVRSSFNDANSTTPYCKTGVRESFGSLDTLLIEITPYSVLCPSTTLFLFSFVSFWIGIFTFNFLHTEDIDLVDGYSYFIIAGLMSLDWSVDWQTVLVSLQALLPLLIWSATLLLPIGHCLCKTFLPGIYWRSRQCMRSQREAMWKIISSRGEMVDNVDTERGAEAGRANEETSLITDEGRTQIDGRI